MPQTDDHQEQGLGGLGRGISYQLPTQRVADRVEFVPAPPDGVFARAALWLARRIEATGRTLDNIISHGAE